MIEKTKEPIVRLPGLWPKILTSVFVVLFALGLAPLLFGAPIPQKIVSGTVGSDEIVFQLLQQKGELNRLVALSVFSDDARYSHLTKIPASIKGRVGNSLEALYALRPDFAILASYNKQELVHQLQKAGVRVIVQEKFRSVEDIRANIQAIGAAIGAGPEAKGLIAEMDERMAQVVPSACPDATRPTVLQYSEYDTVPGSDTIFHSAALKAGFENLAAKTGIKGWGQISHEVLVTLNPDLIVASAGPDEAANTIARIQRSPGWKSLKAAKEARILLVEGRTLYTVSHYVTELVSVLAKVRRCTKP